jgi:hypothetical protein
VRCTRLWISSIPATSAAKRGEPVTLADLSPERTDMDALCPLVESNTDTAHDRLTLGAILRAFLPALLHLLKLGKHKVRVLWHLAACGTPALGANLFHCPHCQHRHWAPIFSIVHTASTDTGRLVPAATGIVRAAWPPKAAIGQQALIQGPTEFSILQAF